VRVGGELLLLELAHHPGGESETWHRLALAAPELETRLSPPKPRFETAPDLDLEASHALTMAIRFSLFERAEHVRLPHMLLGLIWHPWHHAAYLAGQFGVEFESAFSDLTDWRRPPPDLAQPTLREIPDGEPVYVPYKDLQHILRRLGPLLPDGAPLSFNHDYERAWFRSGADINLQHAVEIASRAPGP
jgi:hypothetical protein